MRNSSESRRNVGEEAASLSCADRKKSFKISKDCDGETAEPRVTSKS